MESGGQYGLYIPISVHCANHTPFVVNAFYNRAAGGLMHVVRARGG